MARIYFHSEHDTAELRGSERAYMGNMCMNQLLLSMDLYDRFNGDKPHWAAKLFPVDHYIHRGYGRRSQQEAIQTALAVGQDTLTLPDGRTTTAFSASLNTAIRIGGDALRLMARLHGQCEIHCWIDGTNRAWLADIIEQGRVRNLYRADQGWEAVATMLRSRDDGPVVCSYSVCESFPNAGVAEWEAPEDEDGEPNYDAWYDLPHEERWTLGMQALRKSGEGHDFTLELRPDAWEDYIFWSGITGYDIAALAPTLA